MTQESPNNGEWVLIWMIFQSELGTTIIAPPPIYFHDRAA
jgi:hypothetical protein